MVSGLWGCGWGVGGLFLIGRDGLSTGTYWCDTFTLVDRLCGEYAGVKAWIRNH